MNIPGPLDQKNMTNLEAYYWRLVRQGGSFHWRARDLQDYRDEEGLRQGRRIAFEVRRAKYWMGQCGKVVSINSRRRHSA